MTMAYGRMPGDDEKMLDTISNSMGQSDDPSEHIFEGNMDSGPTQADRDYLVQNADKLQCVEHFINRFGEDAYAEIAGEEGLDDDTVEPGNIR
jgi:hypothetical protein